MDRTKDINFDKDFMIKILLEDFKEDLKENCREEELT
jgi:hypothetical protein